MRFYREVEVKHARVAMLAAVGFPIAEQFHPLFATDDAPSFAAFQQTPLQTFWPAVVFLIAVIEVLTIFPAFENPNVEGWAISYTMHAALVRGCADMVEHLTPTSANLAVRRSWNPGLNPTMYTPIAHDYCVAQRFQRFQHCKAAPNCRCYRPGQR